MPGNQIREKYIFFGWTKSRLDGKPGTILHIRWDISGMAVDILLVDDDAVQGATRKAILDRAGLLAVVVSHGQDALNFLRSAEGFTVRMVVTDHLMPGMNGPEFVRALRKAGYAFPVLVLSGYPDVEDEYKSLDVAFRVKPFPPDQLIAFAHYLLNSFERRSA